jgi:ATP-dependent DNA helicase RecG
MININSLERVNALIADAETLNVEFKETTGQLERGMETLCAFLNGSGETVLFGIANNGKIVGQEVSDTTKKNIAEAIKRLESMTSVLISYIPLPNSKKRIIALNVDDVALKRPFCYKGRPYMRIESVTTTMPQPIYNELLMQREGGNNRWETYPNEKLKLSDLDEEEILKTVRLGVEYGRLPETTGNDIPAILEKLGLIENHVLNHASAILFAKKKLVDYPQCLLRLARFKGTEKTVFLDNQRIYGNLFHLLDAAMTFIFKHLSLSGATNTMEREELLSIPYKAIREGIVNALCHRNYRMTNGSIGIAIYDDRVEIENPGTFPVDWDLDKLKSEHGSRPHNPLIADVLYIRKISESWGRGISLMISECEKANLPEPEYHFGANEVRLIFHYHEQHHPSTTQVPSKLHPSTTQVQILIETIGMNSYSTTELMEILQLKNRRYFTNDYLKPSLEQGFVAQIYPEQPRHPKQKYYLTEKGKQLLEQQA